MNNKLTPEDAQQLTKDLQEIVINQDPQSHSLLEVIIDQYLYSLNDNEVDELRGIMSKEFGYDQMDENDKKELKYCSVHRYNPWISEKERCYYKERFIELINKLNKANQYVLNVNQWGHIYCMELLTMYV